jgi:arylsulfatase A-like enzyme
LHVTVRNLRRTRLIAIAAGLLLVQLALPGPFRVPATEAATRPNVLIIVTDDQRIDQLASMPNVLSTFVSGGTTFTKAYAETPLCCPSRASIMTGRYSHNHKVTKNDRETVLGLNFSTTVARYLRDAGYRTGIAGKIFNGWPNGKAPPFYDRFAVTRAGYENAPFNVDGTMRTDTGYSTEFVSDQAVEFLDAFEQQDDTDPWFLYLAPFAPHWPYTPAPQDAAMPVAPLPPSPSRTEVDRSDKPPAVRARSATLQSVQPAWTGQIRSLASVDRMVDRLFDYLDQRGEGDTIAFFLADNGYLLAEHGLGEDKQFPYTAAIRVPFLMRWPGHVAANAIDKRRVLNADIAPTILRAVGLPLPTSPKMDGRNLLGAYSRTRTFVESFADAEPESDFTGPSPPAWASLVTDTYQYTEWYADDSTTITFREYYDLVKDPNQLVNLLGDGNLLNDPLPTRLLNLHNRLVRDRVCKGTSGTTACP